MVRLRELWVAAVFALFGACVLLCGCAVGSEHTSDAKLKRNLFDHEAEFDALLAEVQGDERLTMVSTGAVLYGGQMVSAADGLDQIELAGLTKERWAGYQHHLRDLGLSQVTKGDRGVEFRVDPGSLFNGDSYKGYEYSLEPPRHPKSSLDRYKISEADRDASGGYYVSKPLKGHWRLYLYVSG
jgi:hypothetical protein